MSPSDFFSRGVGIYFARVVSYPDCVLSSKADPRLLYDHVHRECDDVVHGGYQPEHDCHNTHSTTLTDFLDRVERKKEKRKDVIVNNLSIIVLTFLVA